MNRLQAYKFKMKKLKLNLIAFTPLVIFMCFLTINQLPEVKGAMLILNCIAVACTTLHYRLNNKAYSFYYVMIYASGIFNTISHWFFYSSQTISLVNLITTTLGALWLWLIWKEYNFIDKIILTHKTLCSIIVSTIYTYVIYISDYKLVISNNKLAIITILIEINSIVGIFIITHIIKISINRKEFLYTIHCNGMVVSWVGSFLIMNFSKYSRIISSANIVLFISYLIAILGLFIEFYFLSVNNARLEVAVEDAKKVEELKSNFFAVLTHELKTPVNMIFSCVQLLDTQKDSSAEILQTHYKKYSVPLRQNCYRMLRLINNIVDMTKINSGHFNMRFINCDIISLVENITLSIVPYVFKNNIEIIFDTIVEELEIKCDKDSIERIMLNLLSNSIKYTPDGGKIEVYIDVDTEFVYIRVKDNGCGIPKEKQEKIFDVFVQGDISLSRTKEGSGIGLSLVKSLITLHDGYVYIEESSKEGTVIVLQIPNKRVKDESDTDIDKGIESNIINKVEIEFSDIYDIQ